MTWSLVDSSTQTLDAQIKSFANSTETAQTPKDICQDLARCDTRPTGYSPRCLLLQTDPNSRHPKLSGQDVAPSTLVRICLTACMIWLRPLQITPADAKTLICQYVTSYGLNTASVNSYTLRLCMMRIGPSTVWLSTTYSSLIAVQCWKDAFSRGLGVADCELLSLFLTIAFLLSNR